MAKFKIEQERENCIGCGNCASVCPSNWKMDEDGKSSPIKTELDEIGCNQATADNCPVQIIKIIKTGGKKIK